MFDWIRRKLTPQDHINPPDKETLKPMVKTSVKPQVKKKVTRVVLKSPLPKDLVVRKAPMISPIKVVTEVSDIGDKIWTVGRGKLWTMVKSSGSYGDVLDIIGADRTPKTLKILMERLTFDGIYHARLRSSLDLTDRSEVNAENIIMGVPKKKLESLVEQSSSFTKLLNSLGIEKPGGRAHDILKQRLKRDSIDPSNLNSLNKKAKETEYFVRKLEIKNPAVVKKAEYSTAMNKVSGKELSELVLVMNNSCIARRFGVHSSTVGRQLRKRGITRSHG